MRQSILSRAMDPNNVKMFYGSACLVCLKASPDIKHCSRCRIAPYCSEEHQRLDWNSSHKSFCRAIRNCKLKFTGKTFEEFRDYKVALRLAWESDLNRELYVHEEMMTLYPRVCVICFTKEGLFTCEKCLNVFYCSEKHKNDYSEIHVKFCNELRLGLVTDQYMRTRGITYVEFEPVQDRELRSCRDIQKHLTTSTRSVLYNYLSEKELEEGLQIAKTLCVVLGLNVLHCLRTTKIIKPSLVFHIVGADLNELLTDWLLVTNIIRYWIPEITGYIKYYLVGPGIVDQNVQQENTKEDKMVIKYFGRKYHEVIELLERPDMVFAFNCGLHEYAGYRNDPWKLSIPTLFHYEDVPLAVTSYTQSEMIRDKKILESCHGKLDVILDIGKNPFASIKPFREWGPKEKPIFYMCKYIFIARKVAHNGTIQNKI